MDRRSFMKNVGAGTALALTPVSVSGARGPLPEEGSESSCGSYGCGDSFTIVKTGEDERGVFVFALQCDDCGDVSPWPFDLDGSHNVVRWCELHKGVAPGVRDDLP